MIVFPLANANASVISVTGSAATLLALIDAAGAVNHAFRPNLDAVNITPEDGDIRVIYDNSTAALAPTASKGFLIKQGATHFIRFQNLAGIKLIATTGTVSCSVQIGTSEAGETSVVTGGGGSITSVVPGTGATNLGKAEDAAHTSGDTGVMALGVSNEAQTNISGTDGDYTPIGTNRKGTVYNQETMVDQFVDNTNAVAAFCIKPLASATYSLTTFSNWGSNTTLNVKASQGNIYSLYAYQTNASSRFEQIHNTATTPSASAVPVFSFLVEASKDKLIGSDFFGPNGYNCSSGIAFGHSSAYGIYTAGTAADGNRTIQYK